jgi:GxxExxY protein
VTHTLAQIAEAIARAAHHIHGVMGTQQKSEDYAEALANHLAEGGLAVERHVAILLPYDGRRVDTGHTIDLVVERKVAVDIATESPVGENTRIDFSSHMQLGGYGLGVLLDFRATAMAEGMHMVKRA